MKSRIGVNVGKCSLQIDQFQGRPSPKYARAAASKNRRRFASRAICLPNTLEQARLARTVRTSRLGRQSVMTGAVVVARSSTVASRDELECGAATDKASLSAISATCTGSQKHSGGSGCGSSSNVLRWARIKQALLVSRQPSPVPCTPGPCPGSRVRIRPPSHSTTARFGGASGCRARAPSPLGSLSRRWASSQPMSWTTRSIVLAETGWSPALRSTRAVRSKDRVSAAVTVIFLTSKGVNSRASRPRTSRRGKKIAATLATVADQIGHLHIAVDRDHLAIAALDVADRSAMGTAMLTWLAGHNVLSLPGLDQATQTPPQLVCVFLDDGIVRHSFDGSIGPAQGH